MPSAKTDIPTSIKSGATDFKVEIKNVDVGAKGTGNTVNDYLDNIIVNGKVDPARMIKFKNAIQNNTFSIDELSEIGKKCPN